MVKAALMIDATLYNSLGLVFVAFGVLVTIRFLGFPDLTPDGSFTIAACVFARLLDDGNGEGVCFLGGILVGIVCGTLTIALNELFRIGKLLSSVVVMILAISAAPYVLGKATIGLLDGETFVNQLAIKDGAFSEYLLKSLPTAVHPASVIVLGAAIFITGLCLCKVFRTRWGVTVRYLGSSLSPGLVVGRLASRYKLGALLLGNSLVAVGGIIEAQRRGSADQGMGLGIVVAGISALIVGESLMRWVRSRRVLSVSDECMAAVLGVVVYSFLVQLVLLSGIGAVDLRILTAAVLVVALALTHRFERRTDELF